MSANLNPSRYAHCEGHTGVCFSQDARYIITCGGEGDIRIWTGIEDDEAVDKCVGEQAFAVCQRGDKLYVGTDQNSVQALTFPEPELDGVVARFTAPVTHIDASADGSLIVAASCDMKIGITDTSTSTTDMLSGHRAPVLSVSLDPKLEFLASSSCDGTVRVWKLSDRQQLVSWECVPKSNSRQHATALGVSAWVPGSGTSLAVPDGTRVHLYRRNSWEKTVSFSDPEPGKQLVSVVKFSSCGQYLAASTTEGHILIFNSASQQLLSRLQTDERQHVCSLDWSSEIAQIAFCDTNGNFGTVDLPSTPAQANKLKAEDVPIADPTFGDTDDEDNENAISLEKIKNESGFLTDGLIDDDDKTSNKDGDDGRSSRTSDVKPVTVYPKVELQPPFQPASTPVSLQYRFMVWNDIGIVKQTNTDDENAIDVEFHDTGLHHSFRVNNVAGHTMAALSEEVLVLACEAQDDNPSKLVCVMLNAWDGSREWSVVLEGEEEVLCVAAGHGFVAVATDTRMLRVFTTCGTQREVVSLPGPIVCMVARDYSLAVVFHTGAGLDGDQRLSYIQLWLGCPSALVRPCPVRELPISPCTRLRWLGHSDEGSLCTLDTAGLLRKLTSSGLWAPVCDVDSQCKGKSDHHFVVGVCEKFQTIRSVLCKGSFFPPTMPRPAVAEISWQVPLCEVKGEKGDLEEQFWRAHIAQPALPVDDETARDNADRTIKKTLLKLFALACQSGLDMRAVGLIQLMSPEVAQLAVKYASKLGRVQLADRITEATARRPPSPPTIRSDEAIHSESWAQPVGERETYNQLSQDMFASSAEDHPLSTDNPILAFKQRQPSATSILSSGSRRSNPFKKTGEQKDEIEKGLAGLAKQPVPKPAPRPSVRELPSKKTSSNENKPKKQTFMGWFSSQKKNFEEEFPEMDSAELTKVALKRYKEEQNLKPSNNQTVKKFFGTTISNVETNQKIDEPIPTSDPPFEVKKRKSCDDEAAEKPEPKKKSFSEKLNKFAFVKP